MTVDRRKSLDQLDPPAWGPPDFPSSLVRRCHSLRAKPLVEFTGGDLRVMIGQSINLPILVPMAIEWLECDPLGEAELYECDLLFTVLRVPRSFWKRAPILAERMCNILGGIADVPLDQQHLADDFMAWVCTRSSEA